MAQSPIEIQPDQALSLKDPESLFQIDYPNKDFPGNMKPSAHPVFQLDEPTDGDFPKITFRKRPYQLAQIHIHKEQEHFIAKSDEHEEKLLEIHFVHIPEGSSLNPKSGKPAPDPKVVLGILFKQSEKTQAGKLGFLKQADGSALINPRSFFPENVGAQKNWYHYEGSLTGPPFTENVSWFLLDEKGDVTPQEFAQIQATTQSARGLQPLERRLVVKSF